MTNSVNYEDVYPRQLINNALDHFLESIYHFEKFETEKFGITWDEILLLKVVQKQPGLSVTQLADYVVSKPFVVSRMLSKLETSSHVVKVSNSTDKRFSHLFIAEKGAETLKQVDAFNYEIVSHQLQLMPSEHAQMILSVISRLGDLLKLPSEPVKKSPNGESANLLTED